jgi:hypothetical protein
VPAICQPRRLNKTAVWMGWGAVQTLALLVRGSGSAAGAARARMMAGWLEKFNHFAFTHVALYGTAYREACRATLAVLKQVSHNG